MDRKVPFEQGEFYHVYNRGVEKMDIYRDARDWERFQSLLYVYNSEKSFAYRDIKAAPYDFDRGEGIVDIVAYTLMPNHFHLIIRERVQGGISRFMGKILTSFSMYVNEKYQRSGPLMCRPFRSRHVDSDEYFRWLFAYVHLNPTPSRVRISTRQVRNVMDSYRYSSYSDYWIGSRLESKILSQDALPIPFSDIGTVENMIGDFVEARSMDAFRQQDQFLT